MKNKNQIIGLFTLVSMLWLHCGSSTQSEPAEINRNTLEMAEGLPAVVYPEAQDTVIQLPDRQYKVEVFIDYPDTAPTGSIIMLHGWNLPNTEWCEKTIFCIEAAKRGYILIMPDMGKSTYSDSLFTETRDDWKKYPTKKWLVNKAIPFLQVSFRLLLPGQRNFALGLSTGGRGASLLALECPDIFNAAACLSADFDQVLLNTDPIYVGFYGPYDQFAERYKYPDNIIYRLDQYSVPTYLGHGLKDPVSPSSQTVMFYDTLRAAHPELKTVLHIDSTAVHNYDYWGSETGAVLDFFGLY